MGLNTYYNFKNPIRHFFNLDNIKFQSNVNELELDDLGWAESINFRVWKNEKIHRVLKFPNIINFYVAYNKFKNYQNFNNTSNFDDRKRLVPNTNTGDFVAGEYDKQLENDFFLLSIYDNLIKLDVKSYYDRIYTHNIDFETSSDERFLTNLNLGNTNGLIMGNYLSLYFAELFLTKISNDIQNTLNSEGVQGEFSYFSDDFYFFCNSKDNDRIIAIFDKVLEKYNLERKDGDLEIWTYLTYNENNISERYRKKIISECKTRYREDRSDNNLYFSNQLIYRMSKIKEKKYQKTFLNTFFKSTYFHDLNINRYHIDNYNFHNLCYIYQFAPETLLYSIGKFKSNPLFIKEDFKKFLSMRFNISLSKNFNEEQLYYYFAIKLMGFSDVLKCYREAVLNSNNQILISYYLKDKLFLKKHIDMLKSKKDERYWFQNYHLILYTDLNKEIEKNIEEYLIPYYVKNAKPAQRTKKSKSYKDFYYLNLSKKISFIKSINDVNNCINDYRNSLVEERTEIFGEDYEVEYD